MSPPSFAPDIRCSEIHRCVPPEVADSRQPHRATGAFDRQCILSVSCSTLPSPLRRKSKTARFCCVCCVNIRIHDKIISSLFSFVNCNISRTSFCRFVDLSSHYSHKTAKYHTTHRRQLTQQPQILTQHRHLLSSNDITPEIFDPGGLYRRSAEQAEPPFIFPTSTLAFRTV